MSFRQRATLAVTAAAVQLAGCSLLYRFRDYWLFAVTGFYLSSWLALAVGEIAAGARPDARKGRVAGLTMVGLVGSYMSVDYSLRTGQSVPLALFLFVGVCVNLLGAFLLDSSRLATTPGAPAPEGTRTPAQVWLRAAARLVAVVAAAFVTWQAIVDAVRLHRPIEPALVGDLRTFVSAEAIYASTNSGFYDTPECLQVPSRCLPNYSVSAPTFLDTRVWSGTRGYFRRRFVPGPRVDPSELPPAASPTSVKSYAYVAVPAEPDGIVGSIWRLAGLSLEDVRSYCGDAVGRVCWSEPGTEPRIVDGVCAPECNDLR